MVKCNKNDTESSCRTFKIVWSEIGYISPPNSRFKGRNPNAVAKKFGTRLFKLASTPEYSKFKKMDTIKLMLKETTRGSGNPTFFFKANQTPLDTPSTRTLPNGTVLTVSTTVKVSRCSKDFIDM